MAGRSRLLMYGLPIIAALALGSALLSIARSNASSDAVAPRSAPPTASPGGSGPWAASGVIGALGAVEPSGREVAVATRVAGVVSHVRVTAGQAVKAGEVLFVIDAALAEAIVAQRQRDLAIAEARLAQTRERGAVLASDIDIARNAVASAEADLDEAIDLVRIAGRLQTGAAITEREMTRRRNQQRAAESRVAEAKARLARAEAEFALVDQVRGGPTLRIDEATIAQAQAALALAETELGQRTVRAPSDGTVLAVNIRPGEFAATGVSPAPIVMGRLDPLHVRVDIDEADIPRFAAGHAATALPRGRPDERIGLTFVRAEPLVTPKRSLSGSSSDRVDTRVLQIIYAVEGPSNGLRAGQVVDVFIGAPAGGAPTTPSRR